MNTTRTRDRSWTRRLSLLLALAAIVLAAPGIPALWAGVTHLSDLGEGAGDSRNGFVTVRGCVRGPIYNPICHGVFQLNDPMLNSSVQDGVRVANDPRWHRRGAQVQAEWPGHGHDAYLWSGSEQYTTILGWVGLAICLLVIVTWPLRALSRGSLPALMLATSVVGAALALSGGIAW